MPSSGSGSGATAPRPGRSLDSDRYAEAERECVAWKKIRRTGLMEHARAAGEELVRQPPLEELVDAPSRDGVL